MEYRPRYSQPFTLEEARQLAVPIITEGTSFDFMASTWLIHTYAEISRLQNSLSHLQRTQGELKEALATAPGDPDLTEAFEENEVVMCVARLNLHTRLLADDLAAGHRRRGSQCCK